jgi:ketosteroid isomerase-like protein
MSNTPGTSTAKGGATTVVQAYFAAFARGDVHSAVNLLTEDVVWHVDGAPNVPTVGVGCVIRRCAGGSTRA